ncbi:ATP-dependent helicase [Quadrisphaera sp. GCM10027208]|uniref:ATP-dependent helicase n=1 Tax=Quadrisphaera sp. GCM10027208 TaxID=3273423 RepID=UPI0036237671
MSSTTPVLVRRPLPPVLAARDLDAEQRRVVDARRGSGPLVVLGAPGTGRTTTLVEAVAARVERDGVDPEAVLLLAPTRRAAAALRERVSARLARTVRSPLARTPHSFAFALLHRLAVDAGEPAPRLLSGPEQDRILAELLAGHTAGQGRPPDWPADVRPALGLRGFRDELRDLLMRALERGLGPADLAHLGRATGRPAWRAAARVLQEYLEVTALSSPGAFDPAAIVDTAAWALAEDPDLNRRVRSRWQLVAVDDHHESTEATGRLLDEVAGGGADLILLGDPDATTQSFRGADPRAVTQATRRYRRADGQPAGTVVLRTRWRAGRSLCAAADRVAAGIGTSGTAEQRRPAPAPHDGTVEGHVLRSATQEAAFVAGVLRHEHLVGRTPWRRMAVVVRSAGRTGGLRRALAGAGVPVAVPSAEVPVRDEPAVRPLRLALRAVLHPGTLDADTAVDLVLSPLGGADALGLRRLRQVLRAEERAGGGARRSDALLVEALGDPARVVSLPPAVAEPARRVAAVQAVGRAAAAGDAGTAETVLWALWQASGLADPWRRRALAGGPDGARADRDLDAVVALFDAAARFVDRLPHAGPAAFLAHLDAQDVPADTLAERAPDDDAVALVTAQGSAGREWDVVVVAGVQDGGWPDTRLRGSLLGAPDLVDVLTGRAAGDHVAARREVLDDERRLLHVAVTRARRRLVVTAVRDEDQRPSPFLDVVAPAPQGTGQRPFTVVPRALTLPALVAELRQTLLARGPASPQGRDAAAQLARLAAAGVPGAAPRDWYGLAGPSDDGPLRGPDQQVVVSPSRVEAFTRCGLRWLLETSGGTAGDSTSQGVGTLVHEVVAEQPDADLDQLTARLDELWPGIDPPRGWAGERERRRAHAMLERYVAYVRSAGRELVAVEQDVDAVVGRARVVGRIDRLERDADGRLVVVDLKTGRTCPKDEEIAAHPQLGVYQVAVGQVAGGPSGPREAGGAALVQLGTGKRPKVQQQPPLAEAQDPDWAHDLLAATADGMAGAEFTAVRGQHCRVCPVQRSCPVHPRGGQVVR